MIDTKIRLIRDFEIDHIKDNTKKRRTGDFEVIIIIIIVIIIYLFKVGV